MNFSAPFIRRPVATGLLALGLLLAGAVAARFLPVAALPSFDIPTIVVFAARPGASPETMASSMAAPLERRLGEIGGVSEISSVSATGSTSVIVQFDIDRDIDAAAHDVQAALNAAAVDLPSDLPARPFFRKFNPAQAPVMTIALTSGTLSLGQVYDVADSLLAQRLSQVEGVAQVQVNGSETPAVRIRLDPAALAAAGLSGEDVAAAIRGANVTGPAGGFEGPDRAETIGTNGALLRAADYRSLVLKSSNGATLRLADLARVIDGVANTRLAAWFGQRPAILLTITKTAGANVIETVARINAVLPLLASWMPPDISLTVLSDRTHSIRASIDEAQITLAISIALVLLVVALFMRRLVPTLAAGIAVPLSIAGTLAAMWCNGFALDNFSLMALTVSVGFVVDDAIVMIENIVRHMERGLTPRQAAFEGARQIGFTVLSISLSLVAVFIPVLFMGGILGRLFHEFAATLACAVAISALVSLTLTPMLCGRFMRPPGAAPPHPALARLDNAAERGFRAVLRAYAATLDVALRWRRLLLAGTLAIVVLTVWLYGVVPKGLFPVQDTGQIEGVTVAGPEISFAAMAERQRAVVDVLLADPAVAAVGSTIGVASGWSALNRGQLTVGLRPLAAREGMAAEQVIARLRPKLGQVGAVQTFLWPSQDLRGGGHQGAASQVVLLAADLAELRAWTATLAARLRRVPALADVSSDEDDAGPQADVVIDRVAAARLGVSASAIDAALENAFAQRQISVIYTARTQYRVVLEAAPGLQADPSGLDRLFVGAAGGRQVPLGSVARTVRDTAPMAVHHQGPFAAATISFEAAPGIPQADALAAVQAAAAGLRMPETVHTEFAGNARWLAQSLNAEPYLIGAALLSIYIVLGVLYESLTQPIAILSTLPSAGLGALLALLATGTDLTVMAMLGILLLMGVVKKNAIMLVDFALEQERRHGSPPLEAIRAACLERFRPILMTTLASLLGAVPLAVGFGAGAELRRPLGIAIIGGLAVSQALTLYTTPVVYLALQRRFFGGRTGSS